MSVHDSGWPYDAVVDTDPGATARRRRDAALCVVTAAVAAAALTVVSVTAVRWAVDGLGSPVESRTVRHGGNVVTRVWDGDRCSEWDDDRHRHVAVGEVGCLEG